MMGSYIWRRDEVGGHPFGTAVIEGVYDMIEGG